MKLVRVILSICLFSSTAFATTVTTNDGTVCDFSKIVKNADGTYTYSANLNLCVGKIVQDNATKNQQIADLNKAASLYQVTIQTDEQRIQNWIQTSTNLEGRLQETNSLEQKNYWLYFGLGVLTTGIAAYGAAKLSGH